MGQVAGGSQHAPLLGQGTGRRRKLQGGGQKGQDQSWHGELQGCRRSSGLRGTCGPWQGRRVLQGCVPSGQRWRKQREWTRRRRGWREAATETTLKGACRHCHKASRPRREALQIHQCDPCLHVVPKHTSSRNDDDNDDDDDNDGDSSNSDCNSNSTTSGSSDSGSDT